MYTFLFGIMFIKFDKRLAQTKLVLIRKKIS